MSGLEDNSPESWAWGQRGGGTMGQALSRTVFTRHSHALGAAALS